MNMKCLRSSIIILVWQLVLIATRGMTVAAVEPEISNHIRKCCIAGLRHARTHHNCSNLDYELNTIPPLWRGLCHSTYSVCCNREIEAAHCKDGRVAALTGSRCNEQQQVKMLSYGNCCRACQIGLAVKASENDCNDALFAYFNQMEAYRICCEPDDDDTSHGVDEDHDIIAVNSTATDIILPEDDDDICGKVEKLCQHICENTNEAYRCKCHPNYKLDANNVTCTYIGELNNQNGKVNDTLPYLPTNDDDVEISSAIDEPDDDEEADDDDGNDLSHEIYGSSGAADNKCNTGYKYNKLRRKCIDIDECQLKSVVNCNSNQYCHNTPGSYHCLNVNAHNCEYGYRFNNGSEQCEDIDECAEQPQICDTEHDRKCHNYPGSYECDKLTDKSAASSLDSSLLVFGSTRDDAAALQQCGDGFQSQHGRCMDIDECSIDASSCDSSQVCTNDIGGYHCDCKIGFNLDATTNACVDINECSINNHNCLPTQRCDNTVGSYICTRLQSCGTGYTLNAETANCDDDDECTLNTHNCPNDYECYNTKGSFRCYRRLSTTTTTTTTTTPTPVTTIRINTTTPPTSNSLLQYNNWQLNKPGATDYMGRQTHSRTQAFHNYDYNPQYGGGSSSARRDDIQHLQPCAIGFQRNQLQACVDINECILSNPCGSHQRCINTNGSYRCQNLLQCATGFKSSPDGGRCIDIDECETGEHKCVENQLCRNRNGGYVCTCPPGHQLMRIGNGYNRCLDVNECEQEGPSVCPSNAQCLNTIGSYYCECKSGFEKNRDNERFCLDVDECQAIQGLCQQKCVNFWGGYRCTCNAGYELNADNRTCYDVDECEVHKTYKPCMGFCINVPGSYECSCPRGYVLAMDQNTCRDVDECGTGDFCTGRHDICTNIHGGYKCTPINCPYGYTNDADQKNRCRQTNSVCDGDDCYTKPSAYTYNFITLVSKFVIPPDGRIIFSLRGPAWYDNIDFDLKIVKIQAAANIEKASDNHFDAIKSQHEVHLNLKRSLDGPQDIELELSMTVFTNGLPRGQTVAKILIFVSQYTF